MRFAPLIVALLLLPLTAFAQERRELGAHEHGVGEINLAIAANQLLVELDVPGVDIVGFEHPAVSPGDRQLIEEALAQLERGETLLTLPPAAKCELVSAEAEVHGSAENHGHENHDEHEDEHESDEAGTHTAFEARYAFECAAPENLTSVTFSYFDHFTTSSELRVQAVGPSGAALFTATATEPEIDLSDLI